MHTAGPDDAAGPLIVRGDKSAVGPGAPKGSTFKAAKEFIRSASKNFRTSVSGGTGSRQSTNARTSTLSEKKVKKNFFKLRSQKTCELLSKAGEEPHDVPGIGGVEIEWPLPPDLLAPEVVVFEPAPSDIKAGSIRKIFLNTPLERSEISMLADFRSKAEKENLNIPRGISINLLRILQYAKGDFKNASTMLKSMYDYRVSWLPIAMADIQDDLSKGFMYWHGRDFKCRPILVFRVAQAGDLSPDRIVKLSLFMLEFMIRYGMVPGRVENWAVLVDLSNAVAPSMTVVKRLVDTLQNHYRFRMVWTKIINAPGWFSSFWSWMVKPLLPKHTQEKVDILGSDYPKKLKEICAAHQLEQRFGGCAPDVKLPIERYPVFMPPGPFLPGTTPRKVGQTPQLSEIVERTFHEGALWEEPEASKDRVYEVNLTYRAPYWSLTPNAAEHLMKVTGRQYEATQNIEVFVEKIQALKTKDNRRDSQGNTKDNVTVNVTGSAFAGELSMISEQSALEAERSVSSNRNSQDLTRKSYVSRKVDVEVEDWGYDGGVVIQSDPVPPKDQDNSHSEQTQCDNPERSLSPDSKKDSSSGQNEDPMQPAMSLPVELSGDSSQNARESEPSKAVMNAPESVQRLSDESRSQRIFGFGEEINEDNKEIVDHRNVNTEIPKMYGASPVGKCSALSVFHCCGAVRQQPQP